MLKVPSILRLIEDLELRFGPTAFQIIDHWSADLRAIGIASPTNARRLVYVLANEGGQSYDGAVEREPVLDSHFPYETSAEFHDLGLGELVELIARLLVRWSAD